jgi:hypothetical protein
MVFVLTQAFLKNKKAIKPLLISIILGFGLSAFFWMPALFEKSNILLSQIPIADRSLHFVSFGQLLSSRWGFGIPTDPNGFSYQLGIAHLEIFIIVVLILLSLFIKNKDYWKNYFVKIAGVLTASAIIYAFLLFKPSEFLWENIPLLSEINYPWIVLGVLGFLISLLAGILSKKSVGRYIGIFLGIVAVIMVLPYAKPQKYIDNPDSYYLTNDATTTSSNELMPLWVKKFPIQRVEKKVEIINGTGTIENVSYKSNKIDFSVNSVTATNIKINTIYYPGWKVYVDKSEAKITYNNDQGIMEISIPAGKHYVNANFGETRLRLISDIISLLAFLLVLSSVLMKNKFAIKYSN